MGVHGLATYLRENKRALSKSIEFAANGDNKTPLIVDGWSFIYKLLDDSDLPWVYGGEYRDFIQLVKDVVSAWISVNLKPLFVFDGPTPPSKFATVVARLNQSQVQPSLLFFRTSAVSRSSRRFLHETRILPPLAFTACVEALRSFNTDQSDLDHEAVGVYFADGEGDPFAVELAGQREGYVTGRDSDFVVLNSDGYLGYLPLDELVWTSTDINPSSADGTEPTLDDGFQMAPAKGKKKAAKKQATYSGRGLVPPKEGKQLSLLATLYTPGMLSEHLKIPSALLPLLGAMVGNDFTLHPSAAAFLVLPSEDPSLTTQFLGKSFQSYLFDRRLTPVQRIAHAADAISSLVHPTGTKKRKTTPQTVMQLIDMAVANLIAAAPLHPSIVSSIQQSQIVDQIVEGTLPYAIVARPEGYPHERTACPLHEELSCPLLGSLGWTLDAEGEVTNLYLGAYRSGYFSPSLMDILYSGTFWPELFLENPDLESVIRSISRQTRTLIYSLLNHGVGIPAPVAEEPENQVMQPQTQENTDDFEEEEDLDELIDVVEDFTDDESSEEVAVLRDALRDLDIERESERDVASSRDGQASVFSGTEPESRWDTTSPSEPLEQSIVQESSTISRVREEGEKFVTEYVRRGTRIVAEEIAVPLISSFSFIGDVEKPVQLRPYEERFNIFLRSLGSDTDGVQHVQPSCLIPILAIRLVLRRLHERSASGTKERLQERWTKREARAVLASILSGDLPDSAAGQLADGQEPVSERSIQMVAQLSTSIECIEHLAQTLLLHDIQSCVPSFSGRRLHAFLSAKTLPAEPDAGSWEALAEGMEDCFAEERAAKKKKKKAPQTKPIPTNVVNIYSLLSEGRV